MATARPRTRKAPDARRQEILDAAVGLATTTSLDGITIRAVADEAGIAPGLVHHYFASREDLIADAFDNWCDRMMQVTLAETAGKTPLEQLAVFPVFNPVEQRLWWSALLTQVPAENEPTGRRLERALRLSTDYLDAVTAIVRAGVDAGDFTCPDPRAAAWRMILVLDSLTLELNTLTLGDPERAMELAGVMIDRELGIEEGSFARAILERRRSPTA
jgi:AcrR family transcriptional regulator